MLFLYKYFHANCSDDVKNKPWHAPPTPPPPLQVFNTVARSQALFFQDKYDDGPLKSTHWQSEGREASIIVELLKQASVPLCRLVSWLLSVWTWICSMWWVEWWWWIAWRRSEFSRTPDGFPPITIFTLSAGSSVFTLCASCPASCPPATSWATEPSTWGCSAQWSRLKDTRTSWSEC